MLKIKENKLKYLFVDFENVNKINVNKIKADNVKIFMLVGKYQTKIPIELVRRTQELGSMLTWVKIDSEGKNNLDFHLCYFLGEYNKLEEDKKVPFYVLSKDKGYDGLIKYLNSCGRKCHRIEKI